MTSSRRFGTKSSVRPLTPRSPAVPRTGQAQERAVVRSIDDLAAFDEFRQSLLPRLRDALAAGASMDEILELAEPLALARLASEAALNPELNLAAIKEVLDRRHGKPVEKKLVAHKLANVKPEELDAIVLSMLAESESADDEDNG